jgi:N-methylhydantoinase A
MRLIGVDVGGTFTDVMAIDDGRVISAKVPTNLEANERSVLQGAREVGVELASVFNLATTAGLNAVITRRLPKVAYLTTVGHRDVLDRGRLWRPLDALTDASWRRPFGDASRPLVPRYLRRGVMERVTRDGTVLVPLDEDDARRQLEIVGECGIEGIAICLLHSWVNPAHEQRLEEICREVLGDIACSISSNVSPLAKEYPRASTTVVDVLMKIKYATYTELLMQGLEELGFRGEFNYADCSAMLLPASYAMERPHKLVVGGPAAGTVASAHLGTFIGKKNLLCADVGGTSCDISVVLAGQPWVNDTYELEWDLVVNALSTEIVTLGAGGGSVISIGRSGEIRVGPDSAGADPGPACYGSGGSRPTLTDAALTIGILAPDRFLGGAVPLVPELATAALDALDTNLSRSEVVRQAWLVGLNNIAEGIVDISIRRGIDIREFSLMAFGAAGPMTLPGLLDLLPLESVIVPPHPGGFSALGLLSANRVFSETATLYGTLDADLVPRLRALFARLEQGLIERAGGADQGDIEVLRTFDGRLLGQGWETPFVPIPTGEITESTIDAMVSAFHREYEQRTGTAFRSIPVEGVTYRIQVVVPSPTVEYPSLASASGSAAPAASVTIRHLYERDVEANCFHRDELMCGHVLIGPAIVWERLSTTFIPAGRQGTVGKYGEIVIR